MLGVMSPRLRGAEEQPGQASLDGLHRKRRRIAAAAANGDVESLAKEEVGKEDGIIVKGKLKEACRSSILERDGQNNSKAVIIGADLLTEVFSRLPFEERMRTVPLVCKAWRSASCDPACWRSVDMEEWFARRVEEDYWWEFDCEPRVEFLVKKIVDRSCGQLRELRTMHCSDGAIEYIAKRCPLLTVLSIRNSPLVTDKFASKLAASCPEIQELDVSDCYNISNQALESLRRWKPCKLQIKPLVLYFFWQHMLRIYMSSCKLQS